MSQSGSGEAEKLRATCVPGTNMVSRAWGWIVLAPFLFQFGLAAGKYIEDADRFPGWKGELPHDKARQPGQPDSVELAFGEHGKVKH